MYEKLKAMRNIEGVAIDEMIALKTFGLGMQTVYAQHGIECPAWLGDTLKTLTTKINAWQHDHLEAELRKAELELDGLATQAERRKAAQERVESLKRALGEG